MIAFDVRTAFLILGLLYVLLPTITWVVLAGRRTLQVGLWCGGGLLLGCAAILVGLRDSIPEWITIVLASTMIRVSLLIRIQSLRLELDKPWPWRWLALAEIATLLIFLSLQYGLHNFVLRAQFNSAVMTGLLLHLALLAWRIGRDEQSSSAKWIARIYGLVVVALLFRLYSLFGETGNTNFLQEGLSAQLLTLSLVLSAIVGHFGYVGLALDRALRRELLAVAERARDEESRRLGSQIAQLDRQRSLGELSASLGHELNQPLTAILTNAQVAKRGLQAGRFDAGQLGEFLDKIIHNTQRASQIIERIRGFIRPSVTRQEQVNLQLVVAEVAELVAAEAHKRQVTLSLPAQPEPVLVMGDLIQLSQIILNVVRNALEALTAMPRREICITCHGEDGRARLRICDSGPGLTPEALTQAGKPFFTTKPNGLGMGVSISKAIAAQHGGTLTLANAREGGGAIAELNLPTLQREEPL
jgi:signal transduction histidine kinase